MNWIDLVAEKAITDLEILVSGHTRMVLGNTRMRWPGTRMALGNTRMNEEDDVLNVVLVSVGTRMGMWYA